MEDNAEPSVFVRRTSFATHTTTINPPRLSARLEVLGDLAGRPSYRVHCGGIRATPNDLLPKGAAHMHQRPRMIHHGVSYMRSSGGSCGARSRVKEAVWALGPGGISGSRTSIVGRQLFVSYTCSGPRKNESVELTAYVSLGHRLWPFLSMPAPIRPWPAYK